MGMEFWNGLLNGFWKRQNYGESKKVGDYQEMMKKEGGTGMVERIFRAVNCSVQHNGGYICQTL
jgi:hypothetical protein